MVGLIPLFAVETLEPDVVDTLARLQAAHGVVHRATGPDLTQQHRQHARCRAQGQRRLLSIVERRPAAPHSAVHARRKRVPLALRHPRPLARPSRTSLRAARRRPRVLASTTSPPNPPPGSSAATPTGADPIWFPVNFLLIESLQKFHHYLRRRFQGGMPHRLGPDDDALGSGGRDLAPPDAHLPARRRRPPARLRRRTNYSKPIRTGAT